MSGKLIGKTGIRILYHSQSNSGKSNELNGEQRLKTVRDNKQI